MTWIINWFFRTFNLREFDEKTWNVKTDAAKNVGSTILEYRISKHLRLFFFGKKSGLCVVLSNAVHLSIFEDSRLFFHICWKENLIFCPIRFIKRNKNRFLNAALHFLSCVLISFFRRIFCRVRLFHTIIIRYSRVPNN